MSEGGHFGKYRGRVIDNEDPQGLCRLMVQVPALPNLPLNWALPCAPYGGLMVGFAMTPPIGANVWVEFEGGDLNAPIWSGCFWEEGDAPGQGDGCKLIQTQFCRIALNDETPDTASVTIQTLGSSSAASVTIGASGVTLRNAAGEEITWNGGDSFGAAPAADKTG